MCEIAGQITIYDAICGLDSEGWPPLTMPGRWVLLITAAATLDHWDHANSWARCSLMRDRECSPKLKDGN